MKEFVNRQEELQRIDEVCDALQDERRLVRTPIMEFYGIDGIGKTSLLEQVGTLCSHKKLPYILEEAPQISSFKKSTERLLEARKPAVVMLDRLDAVNAEQLREIGFFLNNLIENHRLFIVLASRSMQGFSNVRSIARKLKIYHLKPLKTEFCRDYLNGIAGSITQKMRDSILDWTRGYPLAMNVMAEAIIQEHLDPEVEQDQKTLIRILFEKVIEQNILATVTLDDERERYATLLSLLSLPRRFNLALMQDIIEEFAPPEYKLDGGSLAYITLPGAINKATNVLVWDLQRTGYCIDAPVRHLLLLKQRIEQPERYVEMHRFLAQKNESFAQKVSGADHIRYLREFFYHLANSNNSSRLREAATFYIEQLAQEEALENFLQLYEEFSQDEELKEALGGENTNFMLSLMRKNFTKVYSSIVGKTKSRYLHEFFRRTADDPKIENFSSIFEEGMRLIIRQESPGDAIKLYNELMQDEELRALLGTDFDRVLTSVFNDLLNEG